MKKTVCVLGGDLRQETVASLLAKDGYIMKMLALGDKKPELDLLGSCDILILPIPISYDDVYINTPLCEEKIRILDVISRISETCFVLGGCFSDCLKSMLEEKGITYCDYFTREELIIKNAVPTVEGAIEIAMSELAITIFRSRILVVGYGRIGKILADRLKALGAYVTVSARNHKDFAWIEEKGLASVHTGKISECIDSFDLIVNTVPAEVLTRQALQNVKENTLIIDLASKPGGVDFAAAKELGKNVIWALSLPGKTAPITSGMIIKDTIVNILTEMEV